MPKVLIVEDDYVIADGMSRHLRVAGFDPVWVGKGTTALARLRYERADVCVLDLMLPELDGWQIIEAARKEGIGTPIVVVSARGSEQDRVRTLELGADDYVVKPFSMQELVARVRAASRRGARRVTAERGDAIEIEELRIDPSVVQAFVSEESVDLTPDRVPPTAHARDRARPRRHARRAPADALGAEAHVPRSHSRRLRAQAPRKDRSPHARITPSSRRATASAIASSRPRNKSSLHPEVR
jgi:DNA-binding response OmpR family regulator